MKNRFPVLVPLIGLVILTAGCASPARIERMAVIQQPSQRLTDASLRENIAVKDITGGQETNPAWKSEIGTPEFKQALESSLRTAGLLAQGQDGAYMLTTHLESVDQPIFGLNMTVTATVSYMVTERATGKEVFSKKITIPYTAKFGDALMGVERLRLANEGAARVNIAQLIDDLFRLRIKNVSMN